jgi:hypothetical protein
LTGSRSARPGRMAGDGHPWSPRVLSSVRGWARVRAAAAIGIPAQWGGCRAADRGASRGIDAPPEGPLGGGRAGRVRPPGGPVGSRPGGLQRRGPIRVAGGVGRYSEGRAPAWAASRHSSLRASALTVTRATATVTFPSERPPKALRQSEETRQQNLSGAVL